MSEAKTSAAPQKHKKAAKGGNENPKLMPTVNVYVAADCEREENLRVRAGFGVCYDVPDIPSLTVILQGNQTLEKAELMAARRALLNVDDRKDKIIHFFTDSDFLYNAGVQWVRVAQAAGVYFGERSYKPHLKSLTEACNGVNLKWTLVMAGEFNPGLITAKGCANAGKEICPWQFL